MEGGRGREEEGGREGEGEREREGGGERGGRREGGGGREGEREKIYGGKIHVHVHCKTWKQRKEGVEGRGRKEEWQ